MIDIVILAMIVVIAVAASIVYVRRSMMPDAIVDPILGLLIGFTLGADTIALYVVLIR